MKRKKPFEHGVCLFRCSYHFVFGCCTILFFFLNAGAQTIPRHTSVSVLDFGNSNLATLATERLQLAFKSAKDILVSDSELSRAAAKGSGYTGSLNLSLDEARDLGAALGSDFYLIVDAQTLRRSSSSKPVFYESYCTIFLISSRSGRLVGWYRPSFQAESAGEAESPLLTELSDSKLLHRLLTAIKRAESDERNERAVVIDVAHLIEEAPDDEKAAEAKGLRLPRPFRRLRPEYPNSAAEADAEATVDVLVDVGTDGKVGHVEVVRWAGFGLDEATVATVRQLHFFPAMRNGTAVPLRVLLRYNFRKPARQ
jgi:TonB family protein